MTGVCSAGKADFVRSLGADSVIDYASEALNRDERPFDAIIDTAGHRAVRSLRALLTASGALVIAGSENAGGRMLGGLERAMGAALLSPFVKHRLVMLASSEDAAGLEDLAGYVARGELRPALDRSYPLTDAAQALRDLRAGLIRGKAAITIG